MTIKTKGYERAWEPVQIHRTLEHQMVHEGKVFVSNMDLGVVGTAINNVIIQTGNQVAHLRGLTVFNESGKHVLSLYENPTIQTIGTAQTSVCVNRVVDETRTANTIVYRDGVVTAPGTLLSVAYDFAKTGLGGITNDAVPEYILDRNSNYYLKSDHVTPSGNLALSIAWYEFSH